MSGDASVLALVASWRDLEMPCDFLYQDMYSLPNLGTVKHEALPPPLRKKMRFVHVFDMTSFSHLLSEDQFKRLSAHSGIHPL